LNPKAFIAGKLLISNAKNIRKIIEKTAIAEIKERTSKGFFPF